MYKTRLLRYNSQIQDKFTCTPGTHDSGADYGCPDPSFDKYGECQDKTITGQLEMGIRYVDMRLKYEEGKFLMYHGRCFQRDNFNNQLREVKNFLAKKASEVVIMRVKDEEDKTNTTTFNEKF